MTEGIERLWALLVADYFTPNNKYRHGFSWQPKPQVIPTCTWGGAEGKPRCWGEVQDRSDTRITRTYQCDKVGKVALADGSTWCGIHSPQAVADRRARMHVREDQLHARWLAQDAAERKRWARTLGMDRLIDALNLIAAGHNDPRALAREALGEFLKEDADAGQ